MTYPPQPPPNPYGQQYPPPPAPNPGYGQPRQYPQQPYPQQPYPQQPYPQEPYYGGQQPPGMYPGGVPPQPPRKSNAGKAWLVIGVIVLAFAGLTAFIIMYDDSSSSHNAPAGTSTTGSSSAPTTTSSSRSTPTSTPNSAGGAGEESPQQLLTDYVNDVNGKAPNDVITMICPAEKDKLAPAITNGSSVFAPDAKVIATPGQVTQDGATANGTGHYSGTVQGKPVDKDFALPMKQLSGGWFICTS